MRVDGCVSMAEVMMARRGGGRWRRGGRGKGMQTEKKCPPGLLIVWPRFFVIYALLFSFHPPFLYFLSPLSSSFCLLTYSVPSFPPPHTPPPRIIHNNNKNRRSKHGLLEDGKWLPSSLSSLSFKAPTHTHTHQIYCRQSHIYMPYKRR